MSDKNSDLQRALDTNNFVTIGQKSSKTSSSKSFHQAFALFSLETHETGLLPNDPIGIEYEKNISPDVFICSYYILEQIHSLPLLSKESRYNLESLWSDFQTGQIHSYQTRVTAFVHPKKKKIEESAEKTAQNIIDTLSYLLLFAPEDPQSWTSVETIQSYFANPADQRQIRQQWAKNISLPAPTAQFFMVGTVLLNRLTRFLSEVKENSELNKINWNNIKEEFKAGKLEKTRGKIQSLAQHQVITSEDITSSSTSSNDEFIHIIFRVLHSLFS